MVHTPAMRKHVCQATFYPRRNQGIQPDVHQVAPLPLHFSLWTYFKLLPGISAHEVWNPQVFLLDFPTAWFLSEISLELLERHMTVVGLEICSTSYSMKVWSRRWRLEMLSEQKRHKSDFIHISSEADHIPFIRLHSRDLVLQKELLLIPSIPLHCRHQLGVGGETNEENPSFSFQPPHKPKWKVSRD